jgi:hypothetical protein
MHYHFGFFISEFTLQYQKKNMTNIKYFMYWKFELTKNIQTAGTIKSSHLNSLGIGDGSEPRPTELSSFTPGGE